MNGAEINFLIVELDILLFIVGPSLYLLMKGENRQIRIVSYISKYKEKLTKFIIGATAFSFFFVFLDVFLTLFLFPSNDRPVAPPIYIAAVFSLFGFVFAVIIWYVSHDYETVK